MSRRPGLDANIAKSTRDEIARQLGIDSKELQESGFTFFPIITPVQITNLQRNLTPFGGDIDANGSTTTLVNNTTKGETLTVPAGKRWYLFGGSIKNGDNVARECTVSLLDTSDVTVLTLMRTISIAAGITNMFPNTEATVLQVGGGAYPIPLDSGYDISYAWAAGGASAGGTARFSAFIVEVDA